MSSLEDKKLGKNKKKRNKNLCNLRNLWANLFIIRVNSWKFVGPFFLKLSPKEKRTVKIIRMWSRYE
jgi:hypothetical protein